MTIEYGEVYSTDRCAPRRDVLRPMGPKAWWDQAFAICSMGRVGLGEECGESSGGLEVSLSAPEEEGQI